MAAGVLKSQTFLESWCTAIVGTKLSQRRKHWPCESWLIGLNTGKKFQSLRKCSRSQHEPMAINQSPTSPCCLASHWLDNQTTAGHFSSCPCSARLPDYVFSFH